MTLSENEKDIIRLIREHDDPEQALTIAIEIILSDLKQHESCQ